MIPKKVHYIWLGGKPKDKLTEICLLTWKDKMPEYEFIEWNESNLDLYYLHEVIFCGKDICCNRLKIFFCICRM